MVGLAALSDARNFKIYDAAYTPDGTFCVQDLTRDFLEAVNRLRRLGVESDVYKALEKAADECESDGGWTTSDGTIVIVGDPSEVAKARDLVKN